MLISLGVILNFRQKWLKVTGEIFFEEKVVILEF